MLKSMTGYGKSVFENKGRIVTIEIKSLNSKQCDISLKINSLYRELEQEIRSIITNKLSRGKIDIYVNIEFPENHSPYSINSALYYKYHDALTVLANDTRDKTRELLPVIMGMPDIMKQIRVEADENENARLLEAITEAVLMLDAFRVTEGLAMFNDLTAQNNKILSLLEAVEPFEKQRSDTIRTRLQTSLQNAGADISIDKNRFEHELLYYLEKMDFSEEKTRLRQHCRFFTDTLADSGENGKKLSFIVQEMGREINTLGSKANDFDIQKIVVDMKDTLEKIKEQLANIL